jgi:hypothetical protein
MFIAVVGRPAPSTRALLLTKKRYREVIPGLFLNDGLS